MAQTSPQPAPKVKEHLYEVDLMRAFIILGVVCVHVIAFYDLFAVPYSIGNGANEAALVALHFTRESFMFITGLVLFITYYRRPFRAVDFWKKRFKLIVVPYIVFTLIYILFTSTYLKSFVWSGPYLAHTLIYSLLVGHQFYLYYIVVSMELYIVFPAFIGFMRRTERWHWWIFGASFVLEIGLMAFNKYYLQNLNITHLPPVLYALIRYRDRNVITYQFWFVCGAIVASRYQQIKAFILKHARAILIILAVSVLVLWGHFVLDRFAFHQTHTMADLVLQPIMIPYSLIVTVAIWYAGMKWAAARTHRHMRLFTAFVKTAAAASFGVFLIHPLVLHYVEVFVYTTHPSPVLRAVLLPLSILFVYGLAVALSSLVGRIPIISYIVGQKTDPPRWLTGKHKETPASSTS